MLTHISLHPWYSSAWLRASPLVPGFSFRAEGIELNFFAMILLSWGCQIPVSPLPDMEDLWEKWCSLDIRVHTKQAVVKGWHENFRRPVDLHVSGEKRLEAKKYSISMNQKINRNEAIREMINLKNSCVNGVIQQKVTFTGPWNIYPNKCPEQTLNLHAGVISENVPLLIASS